MEKLDTPNGLALVDPVMGREAQRLYLTFSEVQNATSYDLVINGASWSTPVKPGSWVGPLDPNTAYILAVRARADGFEESELSVPLIVATRPPTPISLRRLPFDLYGWGIVLEWSEPTTWNDASRASVTVKRGDGGAPAIPIVKSSGLSGRYIDLRYPPNIDKLYDLVIIAPSPLDGSDNQSQPGLALHAKGPIQITTLGTVNRPLESTQQANDKHLRRLIGLPI